MQIPGLWRVSGKIVLYFCNKLSSCPNTFFILLQIECLHLDPSCTTNYYNKKYGFEALFYMLQYFHC